MEFMTFWIIGFLLIGLMGALLTFVRRYKNGDPFAGRGMAGWTIVLLLLWVLFAIANLRLI